MSESSPTQLAWRRFRKNKLALGGVVFILFIALISLLGPFVRPDSSLGTNDQNLTISKQKPGFKVDVLRVVKNTDYEFSFWKAIRDYGWESNYQEYPIESYKLEGENIAVIEFSPYPVHESDKITRTFSLKDVNFNLNNDPSSDLSLEDLKGLIVENNIYSRTYYFGTDKYGRDLLSRLMAGAIISLSVGIIAVLISLIIGITLGALAGYFRGWVDNVIMWLVNVIWSIPTLLLVMAIVFAFGKGFDKVFIAVGLTMWVEVARVVRGQVMSLREKEFVEACRALGYSNGRIIFKHILPNAMSPVIVISAANFAGAILIEAGLSFLGIGAQIPTPSWGNMIKEHYAFITTDLAYLAFLPGVLIMSLVLAFMLVGNGLRDALDVK